MQERAVLDKLLKRMLIHMLNFRGAKEIHEKLGFFVGMTYLDDACKSNIQSDNIL